MMDEIDHHYLLSLGFNNARIVDPEKTLRLLRSTAEKAQVQLLKAKLIAGPEHLRFAARNALHSFRSKSLDPRALPWNSYSTSLARDKFRRRSGCWASNQLIDKSY